MEYYLLYQTDIWYSKNSKILFGLFESFNLAVESAKLNNLYSDESGVLIEVVQLNTFQEH